MRRISRTNSHKYLDESLRREYREANEYDEVLCLWPQEGHEALIDFGSDQRGTWLSKRWTPRNEIHHIAEGSNGADRTDVTSNLVAVSWLTHKWLGRYRSEAMALCMRAKVEKGEWDDAVMRSVFGLERPGASVAEFIGRKRPFVWPWVEQHWQFCLAWEKSQRGAA